jgi:hypothetical protein
MQPFLMLFSHGYKQIDLIGYHLSDPHDPDIERIFKTQGRY